MINEERRFAIKTLTSLYSPSDFQIAVQCMPDEVSDVGGKKFNEYFDFLQAYYSLKGDFMLRSEEDLSERLGVIRDLGEYFGFPTNALDTV